MNQIGIVREREEGAVRPVDAFREEAALHGGPIVCDLSCVQPRHPGAEQQLDGQHAKRSNCRTPEPRWPMLTKPCQLPQIEGYPDQGAHDCEGQKEVGRQPEVADIGSVDEAGHDHVPT